MHLSLLYRKEFEYMGHYRYGIKYYKNYQEHKHWHGIREFSISSKLKKIEYELLKTFFDIIMPK